MSLPPGFPHALPLPMAWLPDQFDERSYVYTFSNAELAEVDQALKSFKGIPFPNRSQTWSHW